MQRIVTFYEALPRGPAPEFKPHGLFERYQARYFGKNPSPARMLPSMLLRIDKANGSSHSYLAPHRFLHGHRLCSELLLPPPYALHNTLVEMD